MGEVVGFAVNAIAATLERTAKWQINGTTRSRANDKGLCRPSNLRSWLPGATETDRQHFEEGHGIVGASITNQGTVFVACGG